MLHPVNLVHFLGKFGGGVVIDHSHHREPGQDRVRLVQRVWETRQNPHVRLLRSRRCGRAGWAMVYVPRGPLPMNSSSTYSCEENMSLCDAFAAAGDGDGEREAVRGLRRRDTPPLPPSEGMPAPATKVCRLAAHRLTARLCRQLVTDYTAGERAPAARIPPRNNRITDAGRCTCAPRRAMFFKNNI